MDQRFDKVRLDHVPADVAAKGGLLSVNVGWFGGPSRKQRIRDSISFHDNKQRLARLAARAQVKRDSIRVADSLRRLSKPDSP
jgi:hypothetical protein